MKIGIIGTGSMGRALGLGWVRAGHQMLFGSRDLAKAKAVAANGSGSTLAADFDAAAAVFRTEERDESGAQAPPLCLAPAQQGEEGLWLPY